MIELLMVLKLFNKCKKNNSIIDVKTLKLY